MTNAVNWFEIYVDDMDRARRFYETVFQVELESLTDPTEDGLNMMAFPFDPAQMGSSGAIVHMPDMPAGQNSTVVYFNCEDCAVEEARVAAAGGEVKRSKMSIGEYGFVSILNDSEGNLIGLHSLK
jgi:predicted enzyme related to lactoylglutathione lyase